MKSNEAGKDAAARVKKPVKHFLLPISARQQFDQHGVLIREMTFWDKKAKMAGRRSSAQDQMACAVEEAERAMDATHCSDCYALKAARGFRM